MSKICPGCGTVNADISKFCMICGTPMSQAASDYGTDHEPRAGQDGYGDPYQYQQGYTDPYAGYQQPQYQQQYQQYPQQYQQQYPQRQNDMSPAPKQKKKKPVAVIVVSLISLLLIAATVLIVILPLAFHIDVFGLHLFDNTPEGVTERMLRGLYVDFNAKEVVDSVYEGKYGSPKIGDTEIKQLQTMLDVLKQQAKNENAEIKYHILDTYTVDTDKYNEQIEKMKKAGTDTSKIEKMLEVDFTIEAQGQTSNTITALCIKADGRWYVSSESFSQAMTI